MRTLPTKTRAGCKTMTPWEALRIYPPYYVRMLAKTGHATALTDAEIAISSAIDINRVREIKVLRSWGSVTISEFQRFTQSCNFDPFLAKDRNRVVKYDHSWKTRNVTPFNYLRKSPKWESEFLPLLKILQEDLSSKSSAA